MIEHKILDDALLPTRVESTKFSCGCGWCYGCLRWSMDQALIALADECLDWKENGPPEYRPRTTVRDLDSVCEVL